MQNISNSLSNVLKNWFDALKPLYSQLNTFVKQDKISSDVAKNIIQLMKEASIACQKVSDKEYELITSSNQLDNLISNLEKQKNELISSINILDSKKNEIELEFANIESKLREYSDSLNKLVSDKNILSDEIEKKKDEEYDIDNLINEKKSYLKDLEEQIIKKQSEFDKLRSDFDEELNREAIIEEKDRYKYSKAKV